jgi:hypothetical protein
MPIREAPAASVLKLEPVAGAPFLPSGDPIAVMDELLLTLMATGARRWDALLALRDAGLDPAAHLAAAGIPPNALLPFSDVDDAIGRLAVVATRDPEGANAGLNAYLDGLGVEGGLNLTHASWVTSLPAGLTVWGNLNLNDAGIRTLPANLEVWGMLMLSGTPVRSLPAGMRVWSLNLRDCPTWDGHLPADARIGGPIHTDACPGGATLSQWRARFPQGERS